MKTILVVDDSDASRDMFATTLSAKGFRVLQASDGAEGIRLATEEPPDLVLMNVSMPVVNGVDAVEVLKGHPGTEAVPVLVITGHSIPSVRDMAWEAGCDDFLSKPISPKELVEAVERCIGSSMDAADAAAGQPPRDA